MATGRLSFGEAGVAGIDQLDPVAEGIVDIATLDGESAVVLGDLGAGRDEGVSGGADIADHERGMGLRERPEVALRSEVDGHARAREPAAAPAGEFRRLGHLPESEHGSIEPPRLVLAAPRHRELDVIDPDDLDHVALFGFGGCSAAVFGFGVLALGPAVAAFHPSMSWPAHGS